jgi:methionyl-tRNA formyltransferase
MPFKRVLIVSDNAPLCEDFIEILNSDEELTNGRVFTLACQPNNEALTGKQIGNYTFEPIDIRNEVNAIVADYDLVISMHCKQLFPAELIQKVRAINVHPGYNPNNRGWYPQVFSILNGQTLGATIHEIDEDIDHGKIIDRQAVTLDMADTSLSAYEKVRQAEVELIKRNIQAILSDSYSTFEPESEGNLNLKKDFNELREINMEEPVTYKQAINRLRALTHPPFKNAYFIDPETGKKVWISVLLQKDD